MVYPILVLIHVAAAILFLGNISIAPFWKSNAEKSNDRVKVLTAWEGIRRADKLFTMPGVTILLLFGVGAALHGGYNLITTGWIFWSIILYIISGAAFMAKVVPLQKKIIALVENESGFAWDKYNALSKQWSFWGSIATIAPWIAVILMVIKPNI